MSWSAATWRMLIRRLAASWTVVVAVWMLLLAATTLLSASVLYADSVATGALRAALRSAPPPAQTITVATSTTAVEVARLSGAIEGAIARALGPAAPESSVPVVARTAWLDMPDLDLGEERHGTHLASFGDLERHATLLEGRWPEAGRGPMEATISEAAAASLRIGVGRTLHMVGSLDPTLTATVTIVGIWRADRADPYWQDAVLELDGVERRGPFTLYGPVSVRSEDLAAAAGSRPLAVEWRAVPDIEAIQADSLEPLERAVSALRPILLAELPSPQDWTITTALAETLAEQAGSILVSRTGVLVLTIQFAILAAYAVLLVAAVLVERRRAEVALLRSRGATGMHLAAMAVGEAALLAVPAVVLAPLLALLAVRAIAGIGPLAEVGIADSVTITGSAVGAAVAGGLVGVLVLVLPTATSSASTSTLRAALGRQLDRTLAQRLGLDLALLVLAGIALWQLQLYGAPLTRNAQGTLGVDPLLVAAPGLGLLAGAVLATRVLPRIAEVGERALRHPRGLMLVLGARQLARRPLRYTRAALLLMLAAALGTFAAANGATWSRSQADQAAYASAADVRVLTGFPRLASWREGEAYRRLEGVEAATPVVVEAIDVGRTIRRGQMAAIDAAAARRVLPAIARGQPDLGGLLDSLVNLRRPSDAAALPDRPARIALILDVDLGAASDEIGDAIPAEWPLIAVSIVLEDGDRRLHRLAAGTARSQDDGRRLIVEIGATLEGESPGPTYPLSIRAVELRLTPPPGIPVEGEIAIAGIEVADRSGGTWQEVPFDPAGGSWRWTRLDEALPSGGLQRAGSLRYVIEPARQVDLSSREVLRLGAGDDEWRVLPAVASDRFMELTGAQVGETVQARTSDGMIGLRIVGRAALFPTLNPAEPFVVVDMAGREVSRFLQAGYTVTPSEWWLALDDADGPAIGSTLRQDPFGAREVIVRADLAEARLRDPVPLGVMGALILGSIAALVFASVGFVVSATASAGERHGEFALLQALGLSTGQLRTWLSLESAFVLVLGLASGAGLGLLLAWTVLPYSSMTPTGVPAVPPPEIVVPVDLLLPVFAMAALLLGLTIAIVGHQLPGIRLSGVLRARDE